MSQSPSLDQWEYENQRHKVELPIRPTATTSHFPAKTTRSRSRTTGTGTTLRNRIPNIPWKRFGQGLRSLRRKVLTLLSNLGLAGLGGVILFVVLMSPIVCSVILARIDRGYCIGDIQRGPGNNLRWTGQILKAIFRTPSPVHKSLSSTVFVVATVPPRYTDALLLLALPAKSMKPNVRPLEAILQYYNQTHNLCSKIWPELYQPPWSSSSTGSGASSISEDHRERLCRGYENAVWRNWKAFDLETPNFEGNYGDTHLSMAHMVRKLSETDQHQKHEDMELQWPECSGGLCYGEERAINIPNWGRVRKLNDEIFDDIKGQMYGWQRMYEKFLDWAASQRKMLDEVEPFEREILPVFEKDLGYWNQSIKHPCSGTGWRKSKSNDCAKSELQERDLALLEDASTSLQLVKKIDIPNRREIERLVERAQGNVKLLRRNLDKSYKQLNQLHSTGWREPSLAYGTSAAPQGAPPDPFLEFWETPWPDILRRFPGSSAVLGLLFGTNQYTFPKIQLMNELFRKEIDKTKKMIERGTVQIDDGKRKIRGISVKESQQMMYQWRREAAAI